jgi:hypothetical protein
MASRTRYARMAAMYVEWGDVIVQAPSDGGKVIGTVVKARTASDGFMSWLVRDPRGGVVEWPRDSKTVAPERSVWVSVPYGTA